MANGVSSHVVSLGDGGSITLGFNTPIANGPGSDFAVFENGFLTGPSGSGLAYLELAVVNVSSDGVHFFRFPDVSETQTSTQVGGFDSLDATNLHDLAGKYIAGYGTGFDLSELAGVSPYLNINDVTEVRITDVVGSIDPRYGTRDSLGNLINDPFPTPFASGGFDLNGVGVIHMASVPEPSVSSWASRPSGSPGSRRAAPAFDRRPETRRRRPGQSKGIPVCLEISRRSSTTARTRGTPETRRMASASRSGSPGIRGPGVPGAGRRRKDADPFVDLTLELIWIDESIDPERAEEVADPAADAPLGDLLPQRERGHERPPVRPAQQQERM